MTTENTTTEQPQLMTAFGPSPDLPNTADWFTAPDTTLQDIAAFADTTGITVMPIALVVSGSLIIGSIAPADQYYEWVVERQNKAAQEYSEEVQEATTKLMDRFFAKQIAAHKVFRNSDAPYDTSVMRYIHLRDAKIICGASSNNVGFIRVLLSHVSAWTLGGTTESDS